MTDLSLLFDSSLVRFGITGTLISLYAAADHVARRAGGDPLRAGVRPPRWLAAVTFACVLAFYAGIQPQGGAWAGGVANLAGIALAGFAMVLRWRARRPLARLRQPDVAARMLFYAALPLAVGVASGWLTLSLPAIALSAWWCRREDALLVGRHGEAWRARMASSARWVPGVW